MNKHLLAILSGLLLIGLLIGLGLAVKTISAKRLEINTLKEDLNKKDLKLIRLEQQIKELNFDKSELEGRKNDLGTQLAKLEAEFGGVRENEANLNKQVKVLLEEKKNFQTALTEAKQSTEAQLQLAAKENKQALESVAKQYLAQEKDLLKQMSGIKQKFKDLNNEKYAAKQDLLKINAKLELKQAKFDHYKLGINYEFDKKYLEAVEEYKKIIEIDPQEAYANFRLASIYIRDIKDKERADFYSIRFEELKNLESYIKLEQLRFKFSYTIFISDSLNTDNIELPSLFLQPLIENAIKHGISGLQEKGILNISFSQSENNLLIDILDNGKGFDFDLKTNGFGLKLTKDRIELLNKSLNGQQIKLFFKTNNFNGTTVNLIFEKWI